MDELTDIEITRMIERLRRWLFTEELLADHVVANEESGIGRRETTTVQQRDAPAVRHDRGG